MPVLSVSALLAICQPKNTKNNIQCFSSAVRRRTRALAVLSARLVVVSRAANCDSLNATSFSFFILIIIALSVWLLFLLLSSHSFEFRSNSVDVMLANGSGPAVAAAAYFGSSAEASDSGERKIENTKMKSASCACNKWGKKHTTNRNKQTF